VVNPFEVAFRGFTGPECAGFVERLAQNLGNVQVAVVNGVATPEYVRSQPILDADVAFLKCESDLGIAQVLRAHGADSDGANTIAYVGTGNAMGQRLAPEGVHRFYTDQDLAGLAICILEHLETVAHAVPLYGLVLAGGKSTRMKQDKASLTYFDKPQVEHCYDLLSPHCEKVFVSNREEQAEDPAQRVFPQIHDTFLGLGPMGGILSALKAHPRAAWLVLACDLPYVDDDALKTLLAGRNPYKLATAFISENDGFPEPLCAVYEPKSVFRLLHFLGLGYHCPRKVLINSDTRLLKQPAAHVMTNVNSPDEFVEARRVLAAEGKGTT
jgi:molybdopterin-guanine dinucleotide biosynthesis protein A